MEHLGTRLTFYQAHKVFRLTKKVWGLQGCSKGCTQLAHALTTGGGQTKRSGKGKLNSTGFLTIPLSDSLKVWKVLFFTFLGIFTGHPPWWRVAQTC